MLEFAESYPVFLFLQLMLWSFLWLQRESVNLPEWPILGYTLQKCNFGETFIKWFQILYTSALSAVILMGLGLRISALNSAADAAAKNGVFLNNWEHKILLYANKVLVFLNSLSH